MDWKSHLPLTKMVLCQFSLHLSNCHYHTFSEAPKVGHLDHFQSPKSKYNSNSWWLLDLFILLYQISTTAALQVTPTLINILCYAVLIAQSCPTLCNSLDCSLPCSCPFSSQEHWSGLPCPLLQGIFLTQGSNPGLQHCRWSLYGLSPREVPGSLEEAPTHCPLIYFFTQQTHWF